MEKSKIICIVGEAATGKTTLELALSIQGFNRVISYTTRPMRSNEVNGCDYVFIDNDAFNKLCSENKLPEHTVYPRPDGSIWQYGLCIDALSETMDNVVVVNPHGLKQLKESDLKDRLIVILVKSSRATRITRYMNRENGDRVVIKANLEKRLADDDRDFADEYEILGEVPSTIVYNEGITFDEFNRDVLDTIKELKTQKNYLSEN